MVLASTTPFVFRPDNHGGETAPASEGHPRSKSLSPGNTFDKVNPESVRRNLVAMAFMAYALAETEERFREAVSER